MLHPPASLGRPVCEPLAGTLEEVCGTPAWPPGGARGPRDWPAAGSLQPGAAYHP